jgi:hypothetical protein
MAISYFVFFRTDIVAFLWNGDVCFYTLSDVEVDGPLQWWYWWHVGVYYGAVAVPSIYLSSYPCCSNLQHWASVKRLFHFNFLILHIRYDSLDGGSARRKAAAYTQNKRRQNIYALNGMRTHYLSFRAGENISCLTPRGLWSAVQYIEAV